MNMINCYTNLYSVREKESEREFAHTLLNVFFLDVLKKKKFHYFTLFN